MANPNNPIAGHRWTTWSEPPKVSDAALRTEWDASSLESHPAACPDRVMEKMRRAAQMLGVKVQVGAYKRTRVNTVPQRWDRFIEVLDDSLPEPHNVQRVTLEQGDSWEYGAKLVGLWPRD